MNEQQIQKAKTAKSPEELLALAKAEGIELTKEKAEELFGQLNPPAGEISDDELENVAGGGCGSAPAREFNDGDIVSVGPRDGQWCLEWSGVIDPNCTCERLSIIELAAYRRNAETPNDPYAQYWLRCTQCDRRYLIFKKFLSHA